GMACAVTLLGERDQRVRSLRVDVSSGRAGVGAHPPRVRRQADLPEGTGQRSLGLATRMRQGPSDGYRPRALSAQDLGRQTLLSPRVAIADVLDPIVQPIWTALPELDRARSDAKSDRKSTRLNSSHANI